MNRLSLVPWRRDRSALAGPQSTPYSSLQEQFARFFDTVFDDVMSTRVGDAFGPFNPPVNISESAESLTVTAELPGLEAGDIDVSVSGNQLVIKGEKQATHEEEDANYHRVERRYGNFRRVLPLPPESVETSQVEADYKDGVLTITLPKRPEAQRLSRRITVKNG